MSKSSPNTEPPEEGPLEENQIPGNNEISINYVHTGEILERDKIIIDDVFAFKVAFGITGSDDEFEPQTIDECQNRNDWAMWKEAIQTKLNSLAKCEVFELIFHTLKGVISVGYKWVFVRKRNENNEIVRYKA